MQQGNQTNKLAFWQSTLDQQRSYQVRMAIGLLLVLTTLLCFALPVWSQAMKLELPAGPLMHAPNDLSKWEVIYTYTSKQIKKSKAYRKADGISLDSTSRQQKLVLTKTGRLIHEERTDVLGRTTDVWYDSGTQYTKPSTDSSWSRSDSPSGGNMKVDPNYRPLPSIGYRDMDLVNAQNYAGTVMYNKRSCLVFTPEGTLTFDLSKAAEAPRKLKGLEAVAFVDAETRLPVEARARGETRVFQFDPPPTRMQTLPAELIAQIKKGDEARSRLNQPAPRPY